MGFGEPGNWFGRPNTVWSTVDYRGNKVSGNAFDDSAANEDDFINVVGKDQKVTQYRVGDFRQQGIYQQLKQTDQLETEQANQEKAVANERLVAAQNDMALKTVAKAKPKPKGGTILTSPLGVIGNSAGGGKTLIGA